MQTICFGTSTDELDSILRKTQFVQNFSKKFGPTFFHIDDTEPQPHQQ